MLSNILALLVVIFVILFGFNNSELVLVTFLPFYFTLKIKLYFVIFGSFLLGVIICYFVMSTRYISSYVRSMKKNKKIKLLEKQLETKSREII